MGFKTSRNQNVFVMIILCIAVSVSFVQADYFYIDDFSDGNTINKLGQAWFAYCFGNSAYSTNNVGLGTGRYGSKAMKIGFSANNAFSGGVAIACNFVQDASSVSGNGKVNFSQFTNGYINIWMKVVRSGNYDGMDIAFNGGTLPGTNTSFSTYANRCSNPDGYPGLAAIFPPDTNWYQFRIKITNSRYYPGINPGPFSFSYSQVDGYSPLGQPLGNVLSNARKITFQIGQENISGLCLGSLSIADVTLTSYMDTTPPSKVSNINITSGMASGTFQFSFPVPDSDIYKYMAVYSTNSNLIYSSTNEANFSQVSNRSTLYSAVTSGTETLNIPGLVTGYKYFFRFAVSDRAGNYCTNISSMVSAVLAPDTVAPSKITNISVLSGISGVDSAGSIKLKFSVPANDCYKYVIAYATNTNSIVHATNKALFDLEPIHITNYSSVTTGTEVLNVSGLIPNQQYYFRLIAVDMVSNYCTNISAMVGGITTPNPPPGVFPVLIIDNFEDGNSTNLLGATWNTYADTNGSLITPFGVTSPGYSGSTNAAHYAYTLSSIDPYPTVGLATVIPDSDRIFRINSVDKYKAIGFYLKGSGQSQTINIKTKFNDPLGNFNYYSYTILSTSSTWKWYVIPFSAFNQSVGWGTIISRDAAFSNVGSIAFSPPQKKGDTGEMWVDDIMLYNGDLASLVTKIHFISSRIRMIPGESKTLVVAGNDNNNNQLADVGTLTYQVVQGSDIGTVDASGKFIALKYGYAKVKVTSSQKGSDGIFLTAYADIDVVSDRLLQELLTIGPNLVNTKKTPGLLPRIRYYLSANQKVTLQIFDEIGYSIRTIINDQVRDAGVNGEFWDLKDDKGDFVGKGLYIVRIKTPSFVKTAKVVIVN